MIIRINTKNISIKLCAFLIAILPLLTYYDFPGTSILMDSVMTPLLVLVLIYINYSKVCTSAFKHLGVLNPYILMYIYLVIVTIISYFFFDSSKAYIFVFLVFGIFEVVYVNNISIVMEELFDYFTKIYIFICMTISLITIYEEVLYVLTGTLMPIRFTFLPLSDTATGLAYRFGYNARGSFVGFSPFFSEPSHMVQYLLPAVVLLLARERNEHSTKNWIGIALMTIATVISTSTFGMLSFAIAIGFYLLTGQGKAASRARRFIFFLLPILIVLFLLFVRGRLFYDANTLDAFFSEGKTSARLTRGYIYYAQFPLINKIFGIGFNNFSEFITTHNFSYSYVFESEVTEYLNGLQQVLIYSGLIGLVIFIDFIVRIYQGTSSELKTNVVLLVLLMASTSTFFRGMSVFYIVIMLMQRNYQGTIPSDTV